MQRCQQAAAAFCLSLLSSVETAAHSSSPSPFHTFPYCCGYCLRSSRPSFSITWDKFTSTFSLSVADEVDEVHPYASSRPRK